MKKFEAIEMRYTVKKTTSKKVATLSTFTTKIVNGNKEFTTKSEDLINLYEKLFFLNSGNSYTPIFKRDKKEFFKATTSDGEFENVVTKSDLWDNDDLAIIAELVNKIRDDVTILYVFNINTGFKTFYCVNRDDVPTLKLLERVKEKHIEQKVVRTLTGDKVTEEKEVEEFEMKEIYVNTDELKRIYENFKKIRDDEKKAKNNKKSA